MAWSFTCPQTSAGLAWLWLVLGIVAGGKDLGWSTKAVIQLIWQSVASRYGCFKWLFGYGFWVWQLGYGYMGMAGRAEHGWSAWGKQSPSWLSGLYCPSSPGRQSQDRGQRGTSYCLLRPKVSACAIGEKWSDLCQHSLEWNPVEEVKNWELNIYWIWLTKVKPMGEHILILVMICNMHLLGIVWPHLTNKKPLKPPTITSTVATTKEQDKDTSALHPWLHWPWKRLSSDMIRQG